MATEHPEATEPSWAKPEPDRTLVGSAVPEPFPTPEPEPPGSVRMWRPVVAGPNAGGVGAAVARAMSNGAGSIGVARRVFAPPVEPVDPESPERAAGMKTAVELAGPVLPVLVADDCERVWPESPVCAVGVTVALTSPPAPLSMSASGSALACVSPTACRAATALEALPAWPPAALEAPPRLPLPPVRRRLTSFTASPVWPEVATALPRAPELAADRAPPFAAALPVPPESPEDDLLPLPSPVEPDDPESATGLADEVDDA